MHAGVSLAAVNDLLSILREDGRINQLPKDARTLVQTPKMIPVVHLSNGRYAHIGLAKSLLKQLPLYDYEPILLDINIDGLRITKSSEIAFWPIMGMIKNKGCDLPPFIIGIYQADSKPELSSELLEQFVDEIQSLER